MTIVKIQELSQSQNLLNSIAVQKVSLTLSFPFLLNKVDTETGNLPSVSRFKKSLLVYFKTDENTTLSF